MTGGVGVLTSDEETDGEGESSSEESSKKKPKPKAQKVCFHSQWSVSLYLFCSQKLAPKSKAKVPDPEEDDDETTPKKKSKRGGHSEFADRMAAVDPKGKTKKK